MPKPSSHHICNVLESRDQHKDWSLRKIRRLGLDATGLSLPASVDLRASWWNVGNQGDTGSCIGWAVADSLLRYHFVKSGQLQKTERVSVRYVWMAAKETDTARDHPTTFIDDSGTSAKAALRVIRKFGVVKASVLPFDGRMVRMKEAAFLELAAQLKVKAYVNLTKGKRGTLDRFKAWLAHQGPILVRLKCDSTWNRVKSDGRLGRYHKRRAQGGHALAIVGYTPTHFILRNSWGKHWGDKGFAYASYAYTEAAFREAYGVVV